jgi:hypothetical protein
MKKFAFLFVSVFVAGVVVLFSSFGGDKNSDYPGGSPAGYTGSPGDAKDCVACHGGTTSFEAGWITSDIPPEGYMPGMTYNLTVTVSGSGDKGFQVSPQDLSGNQLGTLVAGPGTHLNGGTKYVNQNSKSTANPATWAFQWVAPEAGTGEVTFYGAFTVNKPVTKTSTLTVQENPAVPLEVTVTATPTSICIGDSSHLEVMVSGGSGSYTFSWTSDPQGFTSIMQNPWVSPVETTTYYLEVSDGAGLVVDSIEVGVYCLGTDDPSVDGSKILVYPNPFIREITIAVPNPQTGIWALKIFDFEGKQVFENPMIFSDTDIAKQLDLGFLSNGTYLLYLTDGKEKRTQTIIKSQ